MEALKKRREARGARMDETRHARFIADYVKSKYNHIYTEALHFYNDIQEKNPGKKDLRKTVDFIRMTTQYTSYSQYYKRRKESSNSRPKTAQINDNMVLNITLMSHQESSKTQYEIPLSDFHEAEIQHEIPLSDFPEVEIQHEIPLSDFPQAEIQHEIPLSDFPEAEIQHEMPQTVIPEDMYESLMNELRMDPDLHRIFNDIPDNEIQADIPDNEIEQGDNNDDMWDAFNIDNEQTPLERELSQLGF